MHPLFSSPRRLAIYFALWVPVAAFLGYLLTAARMLSAREAMVVAAPLCVVYAIVCLAVWYLCRVLPLRAETVLRTGSIHLATAAVEAAVWAVVARMIAMALEGSPRYAPLGERLTLLLPLIFATVVLLYLLSAAGYYLLLALEASRAAEARALQAGMLAREAELRALKAQVNPHFLFNSLNSVSALTSSDPVRAREMCILLGDFLRRTLGLGEKAVIPLGEELGLVRAFLAVEVVRFGARIRFQEEVEAATLGIEVPPLLLQPLVENAVVHGIAHLVEGGSIVVGARRKDGKLELRVENSFDPEAPRRPNSGVGLENVRRRLVARYGSRARVEATVGSDAFRVELSLPEGN